MGLTIYYSGRFKESNKLKDMIEEVEEVAVLKGWDYHIFEDEFEYDKFEKNVINENLYGICFSPPGSEPIQLTFASNGKLCSILEFGSNFDTKKERKVFYTIFTKTQYAGAKAHKIVIDLMKYISGKYFSEFKLTDESHYWETKNENILKENFRKYDKMMNDFAEMLEKIPLNKNKSAEAIISRITKHLSAKRKK